MAGVLGLDWFPIPAWTETPSSEYTTHMTADMSIHMSIHTYIHRLADTRTLGSYGLVAGGSSSSFVATKYPDRYVHMSSMDMCDRRVYRHVHGHMCKHMYGRLDTLMYTCLHTRLNTYFLNVYTPVYTSVYTHIYTDRGLSLVWMPYDSAYIVMTYIVMATGDCPWYGCRMTRMSSEQLLLSPQYRPPPKVQRYLYGWRCWASQLPP